MGGEGIHNPSSDADVLAALAWNLLYLEYIYGEVVGLDGEAMRGTDDAALAANYTAARAAYLDELAAANIPTDIDTLLARLTAARAGYLDELAAANLPSDVDDLLSNLAALFHHRHSRSRVYPQDVQNTITLTCTATVNTWGSWTEVVPINTVNFQYMPARVQLEEAGAGATFCIQLGYSTVDGSDPTTAQIMGERRVRVIGTPIKNAYSDLDFYANHAPANAKLWSRVKSNSGNADTVDISVVVIRHQVVTNPIVHLTTWPWA